MTSALLERPTLNGSCSLPWCMNAWDCTHRDVDNGVLHYGRPSSVQAYDGDDVTVAPYQFNDGDETTGPRVEVGAHVDGRHQVPLTPAQADEFAAAVWAASNDELVADTTIKADHGRQVTVCAGRRKVQHGRFDFWLVKLSFFEPNDGDHPVLSGIAADREPPTGVRSQD